MTIANLDTIPDMQSWCRTWPPNGSRHIRARPKLHKKPREACKSSWSPIGSLKSFTLTIPWNSANLVKISPGVIARLHHTDQRQMGLLREQYARIRQFGKKVLPGLFLAYALYAGGIWKGDVLVADIEELETIDASEFNLKRLDAKEVIFPKEWFLVRVRKLHIPPSH